MSKKTKNTLRNIMKSRTRSIKDKSHMLVECILNKDPLTANKIFPGLVAEAQDLRELEVKKLIFEDDEDDDFGDDDDSDVDGDDEESGDQDSEDQDSDDESQDSDDEDSDAADNQTNKIIDDATEIKCQINAKVIENLFDVISDLKNTLNSKDLDETSKQFIVLDTTISYYSDKLQELQAQTNPGTDQTKLEEKLDTISKALDELKDKAGMSDDSEDDVQSPDDVEESEEESDESDESAEDESDEQQESEEDQEEESEDQDQQQESEEEQQEEDL